MVEATAAVALPRGQQGIRPESLLLVGQQPPPASATVPAGGVPMPVPETAKWKGPPPSKPSSDSTTFPPGLPVEALWVEEWLQCSVEGPSPSNPSRTVVKWDEDGSFSEMPRSHIRLRKLEAAPPLAQPAYQVAMAPDPGGHSDDIAARWLVGSRVSKPDRSVPPAKLASMTPLMGAAPGVDVSGLAGAAVTLHVSGFAGARLQR